MSPPSRRALWLRWIGANAVGEALGLCATFAAVALLMTQLSALRGTVAVLTSFLVAVLTGLLEATVVGSAQWWALRPWFPAIRRRAWWMATAIGALIAYVLGYMPSTLMDLGQQVDPAAAAQTTSEPPQWIVLLLAAGLGAVGGAVLSLAQWRVLRNHTARAGWWIPANMLAWLVGMPIIFAAIDLAQRESGLVQSMVLLGLSFLLTGAVVGAIHGAVLVALAGRTSDEHGATVVEWNRPPQARLR